VIVFAMPTRMNVFAMPTRVKYVKKLHEIHIKGVKVFVWLPGLHGCENIRLVFRASWVRKYSFGFSR
jgi:hypothetical protein